MILHRHGPPVDGLGLPEQSQRLLERVSADVAAPDLLDSRAGKPRRFLGVDDVDAHGGDLLQVVAEGAGGVGLRVEPEARSQVKVHGFRAGSPSHESAPHHDVEAPSGGVPDLGRDYLSARGHDQVSLVLTPTRVVVKEDVGRAEAHVDSEDPHDINRRDR